MKVCGDEMITPVYFKTNAEMPWPEEPVFYLMTADGLFLCRNHAFFRSTVPAPHWPSELAWHRSSLQLRYPKITQRQMEQIVAFFDYVADYHSAEAIVLLGWNQRSCKIDIIVPSQVASVGRNRWGETWPIGVDYERPADLCQDLTIFGDVHSHVDGPAYASGIDRQDESHRPGLHIVVGRIFREPPEFFIQAVVDGTRFDIQPDRVMQDYQCRSSGFPRRWLDRIRIQWPGEEPHPVHPRAEQGARSLEDNGLLPSGEYSIQQEQSEQPSDSAAGSPADRQPGDSLGPDQQQLEPDQEQVDGEAETSA